MAALAPPRDPRAGGRRVVTAAPGTARSPESTATPDPPSGRRPRRRRPVATLVVVALAVADAAGAAAAVVLVGMSGPHPLLWLAFPVLVAAGGWRLRLRLCLRVGDELGRVAAVVALSAFALSPQLGAAGATRLCLAGLVLVVGARALGYRVVRAARRVGIATEVALVLGADPTGVEVAASLLEHRELGLVPAGFVDSPSRRPPPPLPLLGSTGDLSALVVATGATRVLVCSPVADEAEVVAALRRCRPGAVDICLVPRLAPLGLAVPRAAVDEVWGIPLLPLRRGAHAPGAVALRRLLDVAIAGAGLIVLAPLLGALVLVLRLRHGGPVLFRQARLTLGGRPTELAKLRTLPPQEDPDRAWAPAVAPEGLCRWLRDSHLDELPQLWSVLRGELSLVGPRPERPYFAQRFAEEIEGYAARTRVAAGVTGWAQVHGLVGDTSLAERARFDNHAIEWWTPGLYLAVLARTVALVVAHGLAATGRKERGRGR